jgi:hypothetical protein
MRRLHFDAQDLGFPKVLGSDLSEVFSEITVVPTSLTSLSTPYMSKIYMYLVESWWRIDEHIRRRRAETSWVPEDVKARCRSAGWRRTEKRSRIVEARRCAKR